MIFFQFPASPIILEAAQGVHLFPVASVITVLFLCLTNTAPKHGHTNPYATMSKFGTVSLKSSLLSSSLVFVPHYQMRRSWRPDGKIVA